MSRARLARTVAAAVPLLLVNIVAFSGQFAYLRDHLHWVLAGQVTVALALESIAVFLALHAHVAALANDSALRLRLAAYAFAVAIGVMNYSHFAGPHWRPTFASVAVGLMSASSPWLWAVHSRRVSRDALMARGLIEPHALRLGATRWLWHPVRSARVMWYATWTGIQSPAEAIAAAEPQHADGRAGLAGVRTLAGAIRYAMAEIARSRGVDISALSAREIAGWLEDHAASLPAPWTFSASYIADVQRRTIAARERAGKNKVMQLRRHTASLAVRLPAGN
jgi:hypothetical protein